MRIKLSNHQKAKYATWANVSIRTIEHWCSSDKKLQKHGLIKILIAHERAIIENLKQIIYLKKGIEMKKVLELNIEVEDVVWLRDGEEKLLGFENIDQLMKELEGIIEIHKEKWTIKLLDEEKLTEKILFSE